MLQRLIHIGLALVIACVFTGRIEAAASHCASLAAKAAAEAAAPVDATPPCHDDMSHGDMAQAPEPATADAPAQPHHSPAADPCVCIALIKAFAPVPEASASALIAPWSYPPAHAAIMASLVPAPDLRPPIA